MLINVKVKTGCSVRDVGIEEVMEDKEYIIRVKENPENNKANIAVIKAVSKYFNIPNTSIKIRRGIRSTHKVIELEK